MKCSPLLTNVISKLDLLQINCYSPTVTKKVVIRPSLPIETRTSTNPNSFKHKVKMHFFKALAKENDDGFVYY